MELKAGHETRLTVKEAVDWIQERRGRRPSIPSIYRWILKGVRGHRLASEFTGGVRLISASDLEAFLRACNDGHVAGQSSPIVRSAPRTPSAGRCSLRERQVKDNNAFLSRQFRHDP